MSEIPDDVMKIARGCFKVAMPNVESVIEYYIGQVDMIDIVARAIMAERERCAVELEATRVQFEKEQKWKFEECDRLRAELASLRK